jgi:hypothetical protein
MSKMQKISKWVSMDNQTFFWHVYFIHMWLTPKAKHFELIEHNFFIKWLKKWVLCLTLKFQDFETFEWIGFSSNLSNENVFS